MPSPHPSNRSRTTWRTAAAIALSAALLAVPHVASAVPHADAQQAAVVAADAQEGSAISLNKTSFAAGEELVVTYATDAPDDKNWVGLYRDGDVPGGVPSTQWQYTTGTSGTARFTIDLPSGTWKVWFLATDGYTALADPLSITVAADPAVPVPGDPNAAVDIAPVVTGIDTDGVLLREGFDDGALPEGWTVDAGISASAAGNPSYRGWVPVTREEWTADIDQMRGRFARPLGSLFVADAQQFGGESFSSSLSSAPVDVEFLRTARLTFDSHYRGAPGQSGVVRASFDGGEWNELLSLDSTSVTDGYDPLQMNFSQDLSIDVPEGAKQVRFQWQLTAEGDDQRYWAIDSVAVHQGVVEPREEPTSLWVVSDIQGHPWDFEHGLHDMDEIAPDPAGLLIVGDIVGSGTSAEWEEIYQVMENTEDIRPETTVSSIGNHERYAAGGFAANFQRFLDFAERDKAYAEYVLTGPTGEVPVITLGQEMAAPSDVGMSEEQVDFFEERLAFWTSQGKQIIVNTHFPLGDTVSASWIPGYHAHHLMNDRLTSILGNYPNAVVFSGHTHYSGELGDWAVQRRTADGHPDGFWSVNTIAMHIGWEAVGENTAGISEVTTEDVNNGLIVESYSDRLVVKAYDYAADRQIREVTIQNPLAEFTPDVVPDDDRPADYSAVDAALAKVPGDLSGYTTWSAAALQSAVAAVERGLTAGDQNRVDEMAAAILTAIDGLRRVEVPAPGDTDGGPARDGGKGTADGSGASALAVTGVETGPALVLGAGMLLAGAVAMIARRLRHRTRG